MQAAVDVECGLIVEKHVTQATNDKKEIEPALEELATREKALGKIEALLADTEYYSEKNVSAEWDLLCTGFNLKKMFTLAMADIEKWLIFMQFLTAYRVFLLFVGDR